MARTKQTVINSKRVAKPRASAGTGIITTSQDMSQSSPLESSFSSPNPSRKGVTPPPAKYSSSDSDDDGSASTTMFRYLISTLILDFIDFLLHQKSLRLPPSKVDVEQRKKRAKKRSGADKETSDDLLRKRYMAKKARDRAYQKNKYHKRKAYIEQLEKEVAEGKV